jgi:hypothetical protein
MQLRPNRQKRIVIYDRKHCTASITMDVAAKFGSQRPSFGNATLASPNSQDVPRMLLHQRGDAVELTIALAEAAAMLQPTSRLHLLDLDRNCLEPAIRLLGCKLLQVRGLE